ncbi:hypothetical protein [Roseateles sp.]|uniref:hypothetical protein n=1 Tax=Roseateles sp. TaxID=1971397 RepID=UPI003D10FCE7
MRSLALFGFGSAIVVAACTTASARAPILPVPPRVLESADCAALGHPGDIQKIKVSSQPYGWVVVRHDVERGVITKAQIVDSSPKGLFDAESIAFVKAQSYPSLGTAYGCVWSHKWG